MVQSCLLLLVAEDGIRLWYGKADHIINIMRCIESVPPYKYVYHNIISNSWLLKPIWIAQMKKTSLSKFVEKIFSTKITIIFMHTTVVSYILYIFNTLLQTGSLSSAALGKEQSAKNPSAKVSLPSAIYRALGKAFAECHVSTRQKKNRRQLWRPLCWVPPQRHSVKNFFNSLSSAILLHSAKNFFSFYF